MDGLNGIAATAKIKAMAPSTQVIALSSHADEEFVLRAMRAGASAYLAKDSAPGELPQAIAAVRRDEYFLSSRVSKQLVSALVRSPSDLRALPVESLTARQRDVFQLIVEGMSVRDIAVTLHVGVKTVESHRAAIMKKLYVRGVAGWVTFAVCHGLADRVML